MGNIDKKDTGIIDKFLVARRDLTDLAGGKHHGCEHFVLDWNHDPFALPAMLAYADACEAEFPKLANDIRKKVEFIKQTRSS